VDRGDPSPSNFGFAKLATLPAAVAQCGVRFGDIAAALKYNGTVAQKGTANEPIAR
jgi:hypothetical protein